MKNKLKIMSILITTLAFSMACDSSTKDKNTAPQKEPTKTITTEKKKASQSTAELKTSNKTSENKTEKQKASQPEVEAKKSNTPPENKTKKDITSDTAAIKKIKEEKPTKTASKFIEGKHYVRISPEMQTDAAAGKVEVLELMWLGCGHCYNLEPTMLKYKKNHPDFVEFKQIPATLNPSWTADAKTYFLADILDPTGKKELITQIFQAIHDQRRRLRNPNAVLRLFKQFGYTEKQVKNVQNSIAFQTKLKRAQEISDASKADSVPTIIINGKYRTSVYMTGSEENLLAVMKELSEKELKK